jgi:hypothetical protein
MILHRIVELQAHTGTRELASTQEEYDFLEELIESTKPLIDPRKWNYLIRTPFRYSTPVGLEYAARFKPPFSERNVFYAGCSLQTAEFEIGYHWLRERVHLTGLSVSAEPRTYFTVGFNDAMMVDLSSHPNINQIMDRNDYSYSYAFIAENPTVSSIMYPSCRDPNQGECVATFELSTLDQQYSSSTTLHLIYDEPRKALRIVDPSGIHPDQCIEWSQVA